jgi:predicted alpha/beta superfamily hydrolase
MPGWQSSAAQDPAQLREAIVIGERVTIFSKVLQENRRIYVGKPHDYDQGIARYPVMVVLDGDDHFDHTAGVTRFLAWNSGVPGMLVIAVPNTDRSRDLTPPSSDPGDATSNPTHGGAAPPR